MPCDAQSEEVEQADAEGNSDTAPKDGRGIQHLLETALEVEERLGRGRKAWAQLREDGQHDDDAKSAEKAFKANRHEWGDRVTGHDLLCGNKVSVCAVRKSKSTTGTNLPQRIGLPYWEQAERRSSASRLRCHSSKNTSKRHGEVEIEACALLNGAYNRVKDGKRRREVR